MKKQTVMKGFILLATFASVSAQAAEPKKIQVVERERPAEWNGLVFGGRFMDGFLPMPNLGGMTSNTWGETNVIPRDINNGIEDPKWSYWGGNTCLEADGKYHLMVARWPENSPKGHMSWRDSEVAHAVSDSPYGPFKVQHEIGPGHNPTWYVAKDGTYVLYIIDGRYTADSINGPWARSEFEYDSRDRLDSKQKSYLSNNTFAQREDGSFLMINRHGQAWFGKDGLSTWYRVSPERVYPPAEGNYEDPVVWKDHIQYHLIANDWLGRIAWYERSKDGVNWKVDPGEAYVPGIAVHESGVKEDWVKYERIRMVQDKYGRAIAANLAVIDVLKLSDLPNDKHSSKLTVIPMTVGRLLTVLDESAINADTKTIRVKVAAEDGFNPHTDMEISSLRFGASEEVNFGRGSKVLRTKKAGDDLIVEFYGKGNGITADNFAGKLLGKTSKGKLLFGWSRLPGVKYIEPILSARLPVFNGTKVEVEVQNFGQVTSDSAMARILIDGQEIGSVSVPPLAPFEKMQVAVRCDQPFKAGTSYQVTTRVESGALKPELFTRKMVIVSKP